MAKQRDVTPEEFVTVWQTSVSVDEVCRRTGLNKNAAAARACKYRKAGVPLKDMKKARSSLDIDQLKRLVQRLNREKNIRTPPPSRRNDDEPLDEDSRMAVLDDILG